MSSRGEPSPVRSGLRRLRAVLATAVAVACIAVPANAAGGQRGSAKKPCSPRQFYVSPSGSDHANGSKKHPWRTVEHARDHISAKGLNSAGKMKCDIDVNLRAGDYEVDDTITFGDKDSGANGHQVVYRSYDGPGKARFLGAKPVTGWTKYKDHIYKAPVDKNSPFFTLFEDGKRATTARYPNRGSDDTWAPYLTSALTQEDKMDVHNWLWSKPGDWDPSWDMSQASAVIWSGGSWSWFTDTVPILDVNFPKNQLTLKYWTRYAMVNSDGGSRYFLQNSLDFLDQPGEYYLDSKAGELYYWPRGGSVDDTSVLRPTVKTVFSFAGSSATSRVHDVTLDGLSTEYTDFVDWYRNGWISAGDSGEVHKYPEYERQIEMPRNRFGAVLMTNTRGITLSRMHIANTGFTGVYMLFANDHDTVRDSLLENIGADGIKVEGGFPGEGDVAHDNLFTDNYIDHFGELVPGDASGVELMDTGGNEVSHSYISHSARYGISLESRPEVLNADTYSTGNTFKYLNIQQAGLDSGDMGAFYAYGVSNQEPHPVNNHVSQMVVGDVIPDDSMPDSGTRGVHMDSGGCGFDFRNVEVGRTTDQSYQSYQCNTTENDNWMDGFDASKMQYDKIGVKAAFPYRKPPQTVSPTAPSAK
ncbi:right-handed parallel beta-helix repeat-containing protein [Streptomyces sp. NPDC050560]|uniref:right-handed parallel beta-helix repeat-containing protein n=1 Tax=Streptomyces sp. NPDC050560 TaxID=3365630 RepID=UPI0037B3F45C